MAGAKRAMRRRLSSSAWQTWPPAICSRVPCRELPEGLTRGDYSGADAPARGLGEEAREDVIEQPADVGKQLPIMAQEDAKYFGNCPDELAVEKAEQGMATMILALLLPDQGMWQGLTVGMVALSVGAATVLTRLAGVVGFNLAMGDCKRDRSTGSSATGCGRWTPLWGFSPGTQCIPRNDLHVSSPDSDEPLFLQPAQVTVHRLPGHPYGLRDLLLRAADLPVR
jgi:hypothetical protein